MSCTDFLPSNLPDYVTHLECSLNELLTKSGKNEESLSQPRNRRYPKGQIHHLSESGKALLVRYDLEAIKRSVSRDEVSKNRPETLWRYHELLPVTKASSCVSLGESFTPLLRLPKLQQGSGTLWVKDESRLPTGSFKARGLCIAVSMAKELSDISEANGGPAIKKLAMPTNGNAGAALAAYASCANMESYIFCPHDTPEINIREMAAMGAKVWPVKGLITDCGRIVKAGLSSMQWYDISTLKEPYRIEGKKTMGLELADQMGWQTPDVIIYPTGGGTGFIGMWKAFHELQALGWLDKTKPLPRMVSAQASGCAPIVKAYENGQEFAEPWPVTEAHTVAAGIRVPAAIGDFLVLQACRDSGGFACAVSDEDILAARDEAARNEGILLCPEGAATLAAYKQELKTGRIKPEESVVLFNCATGLKYPLEPLPASRCCLDATEPFDMDRFRS